MTLELKIKESAMLERRINLILMDRFQDRYWCRVNNYDYNNITEEDINKEKEKLYRNYANGGENE